VEQEQKKAVWRVRENRDPRRLQEALDALRKAVRAGENLMPYFLEGARAYATLGEMVKVLREVYGPYREPMIF